MGVGGKTPKCTDRKKHHVNVTYMREPAKRASASKTYMYIISGLEILVTSAYIYNQCSSLLLLMVVRRYKRQYSEQYTNIEKTYVYMRAASDLENVRIFTFSNCYFLQYFVGTSDALSVQMTCLSAYMYRQISKCTDKTPKKHYWGGGQLPPCPPPPCLR